MKFLFLTPVLVLLHSTVYPQKQKISPEYFPAYLEWKSKPLSDLGFDSLKLAGAIEFARSKESKSPRDMELSQVIERSKEPLSNGIGPFSERGDETGLIIRKGYIAASWGDPSRVDMTHSVTKSFLSAVIGLAVDRGIIRDVMDTVSSYMPPVEWYDPLANNEYSDHKPGLLLPFASTHNKRLTWDVMLRQTSDWEGSLWGKPDWADRPDADASRWLNRKRSEPGSVFEYNDVRVNALALAATAVWRKSLPQVLKENIMDAIGASTTWRWYGYRNSWIVMDGQLVQSVSGGGHWGGGMFINAYDMARFGLLTLHRGRWNGKQVISESWIKRSLTPTTVQPDYGYMNFFLNTDRKLLPSAPATAFMHEGNGTNIIYVDPENELVVVIRWIERKSVDEMIKKLLEALNKR